jgi:toxin CcdB
MPQFDVLRTRNATTYPLVVDVQAELHSKLATRVVVPLVTRARYVQPATRLTPVMKIGKEDYVLLFPLIASVPRASLGEVVCSLALQRAALIAALDLLITGR